MANHAENYFKIELNADTNKSQIEQLIGRLKPINLQRVYEAYVDEYDEENVIIRGTMMSAWCEPIDAFKKLAEEFPFIRSIRNQCTEEGCDYYSILKFDRRKGLNPGDCFEVASL